MRSTLRSRRWRQCTTKLDANPFIQEEDEKRRGGVSGIKSGVMADSREKALQDYRKKLLEHKEVDGRLKECKKQFECGFCCVVDVYVIVLGKDDIIEQLAFASLPAI